MNVLLKPSILLAVLFFSSLSFGQNKPYELETKYMDCMCSLFEDNGETLKKLINTAEEKLITANLLKNTSGESYIELYKNIEKATDGGVANFGISDYVIKHLQGGEHVKNYMNCMNSILKAENYEGSKLSKFIMLSTSGNDPKITALAGQMLDIFEAKDFSNTFYKYLTFSLIDKYNLATKKE